MTRRQLLSSLLAVPAVIGIDWASGPDRTVIRGGPRYGHLTVQNCWSKGFAPRRVRVYFNGEELTSKRERDGLRAIVLEADDIRGFIVRYARNAQGGLFAGRDGTLQQETIYGDVRIVVLPEETA